MRRIFTLTLPTIFTYKWCYMACTCFVLRLSPITLVRPCSLDSVPTGTMVCVKDLALSQVSSHTILTMEFLLIFIASTNNIYRLDFWKIYEFSLSLDFGNLKIWNVLFSAVRNSLLHFTITIPFIGYSRINKHIRSNEYSSNKANLNINCSKIRYFLFYHGIIAIKCKLQ